MGEADWMCVCGGGGGVNEDCDIVETIRLVSRPTLSGELLGKF